MYSHSVLKPVVFIPRCEICNGRFKIKEKVYCVECNKKIHYDCALCEYDDDNESMLCLDCYKNSKIEKALVRDGIICSYDYKRNRISIHEECETDLDVEECETDEDDNSCKSCGWRREYEQSHIDYGNWKCVYITANYKLRIDDDGNMEWERIE